MPVVVGILCALMGQPVAAGSLVDELSPVEASGQGSVLLEELIRTSVLGADFPTTATTPSVTYTFDPASGVFVRASGSLGPAFAERGETTGRGKATLGMSYLFASFKTLNGDDLDGLQQTMRTTGAGGALRDTLSFSSFTLDSHVFAFSGTYGITDAWDVNAVVPVVYTILEADGKVDGRVAGSTPDPVSIDADDSAFGIGDALLRTKYRLTPSGRPLQVAAGLGVRLPVGEEDDFQGLGDWVVTPFVVGSYVLEAFDFHVNVGVDANADDEERSRVRWAAGVTVQLGEGVGLLFDFLGSSAFADDEFRVRSPVSATALRGSVERGDNIFAAPGLKFTLMPSVVALAGAIVPLRSDGLQAEVVPTGGVEWTF
jgi:hypothetical protein